MSATALVDAPVVKGTSAPATLVGWLDASLPGSHQQVRVLAADGGVDEAPWPEAYQRALCRAADLQASGVDPGARVALLGPTSRPLVETLLAVWLAGATPVVLPLPLRFRSASSFADSTRARVVEAGVEAVHVDPRYAEVAEALAPHAPVRLLAPEPASASPAAPVTVDPAATAVLQFTSGSTDRPRAVALSHRAVTACVRAMGEAAALSVDDVWVSWLPLYHDMGLIGALLSPTLFGSGVTLMPTDRFIAAPGLWLQAVSTYRGTVTAAPNFAYGLAGRLLTRPEPLDLSSLRAAFCGAEPIIPETIAQFARNGAAHGLHPGAVLPCYGLAETTLAVSFAPVQRPVVVDVVDRALLHEHRIARPAAPDASETAEVVSLGLPLRGTAVRVVGPDGVELGERHVGELHVASPSLMDGYLNDPDRRVAATGWLPTGDLGYVAAGEVYVCGRVKDLIIVNGHNIHPHEVEAVAERVSGVRAGGTVAFAVDDRPGGETIVVLCESRAAADQHAEIAAEVRRQVADAVGVAPGHVGIVAPRVLPKTTSGKHQRPLARRLYLLGELEGASS
jgi:fatty-acyl-CoA synthase